MITRAKYVYWYIGGLILWAGVFYGVGHRLLGLPVRSVVISYIALEIVILLVQIALYRSERIIDHEARERRRMQIGGISMLLLWTAILVWLLSSAAIPWTLALVCWLGGLGIGLLALWMAFKTPLSSAFRNRPNSNPR